MVWVSAVKIQYDLRACVPACLRACVPSRPCVLDADSTGNAQMLWEDQDGVLHCVTHGGGWGQPFGYSYFSVDGGYNWQGTQQKVYENIVELSNGAPAKILSRRERPHVVLGPSGAPIGLTNGVTEAWPCTLQKEPDRAPCTKPPTPGKNPDCGPGSNGTSIWCPVDYCYTLFQPFVQSIAGQ